MIGPISVASTPSGAASDSDVLSPTRSGGSGRGAGGVPSVPSGGGIVGGGPLAIAAAAAAGIGDRSGGGTVRGAPGIGGGSGGGEVDDAGGRNGGGGGGGAVPLIVRVIAGGCGIAGAGTTGGTGSIGAGSGAEDGDGGDGGIMIACVGAPGGAGGTNPPGIGGRAGIGGAMLGIGMLVPSTPAAPGSWGDGAGGLCHGGGRSAVELSAGFDGRCAGSSISARKSIGGYGACPGAGPYPCAPAPIAGTGTGSGRRGAGAFAGFGGLGALAGFGVRTLGSRSGRIANRPWPMPTSAPPNNRNGATPNGTPWVSGASAMNSAPATAASPHATIATTASLRRSATAPVTAATASASSSTSASSAAPSVANPSAANVLPGLHRFEAPVCSWYSQVASAPPTPRQPSNPLTPMSTVIESMVRVPCTGWPLHHGSGRAAPTRAAATRASTAPRMRVLIGADGNTPHGPRDP